jgi:hypothetical protein
MLLILALLFFAPRAAKAQEAVAPGLRWRTVTGYAEVAIPDKYIYHGYVIEDRGPIIQPYIELYEEFYRGTGLLTSASAKFSFFTSLQGRDDGATHTAAPGRWFYEIQIEGGLELVLAKRFTFSLAYLRYESPIDIYAPSNAIQVMLSWDDKDIAGWYSLHPHITWIAPIPFRWNGNAGDGNYFEIGIAPAATIARESRYPITLTVPLNAGFGDDRYYPGDAFGYASAGISASLPLAFLPKNAGEWKAALSATYYYLGRAPAEFTNDGDRHQSVFAFTVSTEFGPGE